MSLIPMNLLFDDWWPSRHQAHPAEQWLVPHQQPWPLDALIRPDVAAGRASVRDSSDKFAVDIDARQFKPEELKVSFDRGVVSIEAKHEESGEHGSSFRQFTRQYKLPDTVEVDKLNSSLSKDGVLTIEAPKRPQDNEKTNVAIPISRGGDAKAVKQ